MRLVLLPEELVLYISAFLVDPDDVASLILTLPFLTQLVPRTFLVKVAVALRLRRRVITADFLVKYVEHPELTEAGINWLRTKNTQQYLIHVNVPQDRNYFLSSYGRRTLLRTIFANGRDVRRNRYQAVKEVRNRMGQIWYYSGTRRPRLVSIFDPVTLTPANGRIFFRGAAGHERYNRIVVTRRVGNYVMHYKGSKGNEKHYRTDCPNGRMYDLRTTSWSQKRTLRSAVYKSRLGV